MKQELYQTRFVVVFHNETKHILEVYWTSETRALTSENFREHISMYAHLIREHALKGVYIDTRPFETAISVEDQTWHDETIVPQYKAAGLKRMAFLRTPDLFGQVSHEMVFDELQAKEHLDVRFFDDEEEAMNWL